MRKLSASLLQPAFIFVPFVLTGLVVWLLLPGDYLRLHSKEKLGFVGFFYVLIWYSIVILAALLGRYTPYRLMSRKTECKSKFALSFYVSVTALAAVGCLSLLVGIGGLQGIVSALVQQQVNQLKAALYENYSSGFLTLRYLTSVSAAIAVFNLISRRRGTVILDVVNILMLVVVALVSARILIFQTVIFVIFLRIITRQGKSKPNVLSYVVGFSAVFAILVGFTYSRSAGTYKSQLDIDNPVAVTLIEFSRYIAMPIQVTLGVANIAATTDLEDLVDVQPMYLAPSFLHPKSLKQDNSGGVGTQWYYSHIDVPSTLTTNSAFAATVGHLGNYTFVMLPIFILFYSSLFFMVSRSGDLVLTLYGGVILYAFFELWRTYYFSAGSFIFFNLVFLAYIAAGLMQRSIVIVRR